MTNPKLDRLLELGREIQRKESTYHKQNNIIERELIEIELNKLKQEFDSLKKEIQEFEQENKILKEKAEKYDKLQTDGFIAIEEKVWVQDRQEIKSLSDEVARLKEELRITQQYFHDECDNHEETKQEFKSLKSQLEEKQKEYELACQVSRTAIKQLEQSNKDRIKYIETILEIEDGKLNPIYLQELKAKYGEMI